MPLQCGASTVRYLCSAVPLHCGASAVWCICSAVPLECGASTVRCLYSAVPLQCGRGGSFDPIFFLSDGSPQLGHYPMSQMSLRRHFCS